MSNGNIRNGLIGAGIGLLGFPAVWILCWLCVRLGQWVQP